MDFAAPVTPGEVSRYHAERVKWAADDHRRKAAEHLAIADELDRTWRDIEADARNFDKWQPTEADQEPA